MIPPPDRAAAGFAGNGERLLKPREMANILCCSVDTLRRYRKRGILTEGVYHPAGGHMVLYDRAAILDQLRERREGYDRQAAPILPATVATAGTLTLSRALAVAGPRRSAAR